MNFVIRNEESKDFRRVEEVAEFDSTFPPKEQKFQESQIEFETACATLDE